MSLDILIDLRVGLEVKKVVTWLSIGCQSYQAFPHQILLDNYVHFSPVPSHIVESQILICLNPNGLQHKTSTKRSQNIKNLLREGEVGKIALPFKSKYWLGLGFKQLVISAEKSHTLQASL